MKLKRILVKSKHNRKRLSKKNNSRKISFKKKYLFQQIESPHNTNEYLINNGSSPFWVDEDEESINIQPSSIIRLKDNESTNEESVILNEKLELGKGQMEKCPSAEKK